MKLSKLKNIKKLSWNIERMPSYGHFVIARFFIPPFQASSSYSFEPIHFKLTQNVDINERINLYYYHFFMRPLFHAQKGRNIQKPLGADIHFCSFLPLVSVFVNLDTSKLIFMCVTTWKTSFIYIILLSDDFCSMWWFTTQENRSLFCISGPCSDFRAEIRPLYYCNFSSYNNKVAFIF